MVISVQLVSKECRMENFDYFCVSEALKDRLVDAKILTDVMGSDHCPVVLEMK